MRRKQSERNEEKENKSGVRTNNVCESLHIELIFFIQISFLIFESFRKKSIINEMKLKLRNEEKEK